MLMDLRILPFFVLLLTVSHFSQLKTTAPQTCLDPFYQDAEGVWNQCASPCLKCEQANSCQLCDSSHFLVDSNCEGIVLFDAACDQLCLTCAGTADNCTGCDPLGYFPFKSGSTCVSKCPSRQFSNNNECQECSSLCKECAGSATSCTACNGNQILTPNNQCITCPPGFYNEQGSCTQCNQQCEECESSERCTSCKQQAPYFDPSSGKCYRQCPSGTWSNSLECQACDHSCIECQGSETSCTKCELGMELTQSQTCDFPSCPEGQFYDGTQCSGNDSALYVACDLNCLACVNSATACYYCDEEGQFPILDLKTLTCVDTCPQGTHNDQEQCHSKQCFNSLVCPATCLECEEDPEMCSSCNPSGPFPKFLPNEYQCLAACPSGFFDDNNVCQGMVCSLSSACHSSCKECSAAGSSNCSECAQGSILQNGVCTPCETNQYVQNNICEPCKQPCGSCRSAAFCLSCSDPQDILHVTEGECSSTCPPGTYKQDNQCLACESPCLTCSDDSTCESCDPMGQFKKFDTTEGECVEVCPEGTWDNQHSCQACASECAECSGSPTHCTACHGDQSPSPFLNPILHTCEAACPTGMFAFDSICYSCCQECFECTGAPVTCTACDPSGSFPLLFSSANTCVAQCPPGTFQNNSSCEGKSFLQLLECAAGCSACDGSPSSCSQCQDGFYLSGDTCRQCNAACSTCQVTPDSCLNCHPGTYSDGQGSCLDCESPCATCSNSASECDSCVDTFYHSSPSSCLPCNGPTDPNCLQCPLMQYHDGSECQDCDSSCQLCTGPEPDQCSLCNTGHFRMATECFGISLPYTLECHEHCSACFGLSQTQCSECQPGFFLTGSTCSMCQTPCQRCTGSASSCTSCLTGHFLDGSRCQKCNQACAECEDSTSLNCASCSPGFYQPSGSTECASCHDSCTECSGPGNNNCSVCASNFFQAQNGKCEQCEQSCLTCSGPSSTDCDTCSPGIFLSSSGSCQTQCLPFCAECSGPSINECHECEAGYYHSLIACQVCNPECLSCSGPSQSQCTECSAGLALFSSRCVDTCPTNHTPVDGICEECPALHFIFNQLCLQCPLSVPAQLSQLQAALFRCIFTQASFSHQSDILDIAFNNALSLVSSSSSFQHLQSILTLIRNSLLSIALPQAERGAVIFLRIPLSSDSYEADSGTTHQNVRTLIKLPSQIAPLKTEAIALIFRESILPASLSDFTPPTIDLTLHHNQALLPVSNLPYSIEITFDFLGSKPSESISCAFWDGIKWSTYGIQTHKLSSTSLVCKSSHLSLFSLMADGNGVSLIESAFFLFAFYILGGSLLLLILIAVATDCCLCKKNEERYPHRSEARSNCCVVFKYSLLYNLRIVEIWGFQSKYLLSYYKAMWFSDLVWLVSALFLLLFKYELLSADSPGTLICVSLLSSLVFLPYSFLRWCLVRHKRISVEFQNVAISTNRVHPALKQNNDCPAQINEILDSNGPKIEFYDKENQPTMRINQSGERRTVYQEDEFPRSISIIVLLIFTFLAWVCGILSVAFFESQIYERRAEDYRTMLLYGILGAFMFGYFFGFIKIGLAALVSTNCRVSRCLRGALVDSLTLRISEDLASSQISQESGVKKEKKNYRMQTRVKEKQSSNNVADADISLKEPEQ